VTPATVQPHELVESLGPVPGYLVVVDFDGTLAPIADRPEDARPAPGATDALSALAQLTTVATLSGRPIEELEQHLPDEILLVGGHGAQGRDPGRPVEDLVDLTTLGAVLDQAEADVRAAVDDGSGWLVERKLASLAVHHRLVPEDEEAELLPRINALLEARRDDPPGFTVMSGKAIIELRPTEIDKGRALLWMLERHRGLVPLVFGDDHTDEDAFEVAVQRGGRAVIVGADARPTSATDRLEDPAAVVATLEAMSRPGGE
jgi:trehalose 6-phosphate phosphatase